ncbi:MAG: hypothetical protein KDA84_21845 [Planctomycetaceae bacterium]|nr:hypothetical protein [Planctomycetaceae bacterium]
MRRGFQKLFAFLTGFPLFVATFGSAAAATEVGDTEVFPLLWALALVGLMLWLWGLFAPMNHH